MFNELLWQCSMIFNPPVYLLWFCKKKNQNMLLTVSVHYSHANALQCKNRYLKNQDSFDRILENIIKKLIIRKHSEDTWETWT